MKIKKVVKYQYGGMLYDSEKKAIAANENDINMFINRMISKINSTAKNANQYMPARAEIEITQYILDRRDMLAGMLTLDLDYPNEGEDHE